MIIFFLILFCSVVLLLVIWQVCGGFFFCPTLATPKKYVNLIKKNICTDPTISVLDLGCGDATTLRMYASLGIKNLRGYELNMMKIWQGRLLNWWYGWGKITIVKKNIFSGSLRGFNYVHCYLLPSIMAKLEKNIRDRIDDHAVVIAVSFPFPSYKPFKVIRDERGAEVIFLYRRN